MKAIENTELKTPAINKAIPTVAKVTQGEVVNFAAKAIAIMRDEGVNVLVEGREVSCKCLSSFGC